MTSTIDRENTYTTGVYSKRPISIVRGSGALVWDEEGREYIDCAAGHGVANIGHGRPEIAAALAAQAHRLITCPEIVYNDMRARLLERLANLTPQGLDHIFLCNSGTEAIEGAFKFARLATGRTGIIATLRSFHGRTMGSLSATWEPHYREPFAPLVPEVTHIRYNDLAAAEAAINEQTAAVIIELVQGEGGVHLANDEYVQGLASLCHERGALLIIDEVQTGFGRTGRLFACHHYDLQPDILCLAKSLAGGVPMGAICLGPRVIESGRITRGVHGSTFGGNPLACAAALTTLDIIQQEALPERAASLGEYALQRLRAIRSPLIREIRGRGLLIGIELTCRSQPYLEKLTQRGVIALLAGPNVIRLLPPLVITQQQLDRVLDIVEEVVTAESRSGAVLATANVSESHGGRPPGSPPHIHNHPRPYNDDEVAPQGRAVIVRAGEERCGGGDPGGRPMEVGSRPGIDVALTISGGGDPGGRPGSEEVTLATPAISLLHNMLTISSYSGQESALARYLAEQAQQMGLHTTVDETGNFIASTHPLDYNMQQSPIILLGHMDTVRGHIPVRLQDGILYGRGAVDAKGPLAAFICAAARIANDLPGDSIHHPIIVVGAVEEESATSRGARAVVAHYRPAACIIGEPSGSHAITIGYKGRLLVEYSLSRPVHHSAGQQANSSEIAIAFWNRVQNHAAAWNEQHAPHSAFAALMPSLRSINSSQDGLEEHTQLLIGYRLPPDYDIAGLRDMIGHWAREDDASINFHGEEAAFQSTRTTSLARAFSSAIRAAGGQPIFKHKTGTSDMNVVGPVWGQNIVAYGPGDSRLDHTPQEHIQISEYLQAIDILQRVLGELALRKETLL
ncbi:MAG TPA: [LysW]-lysine hydrolase [Ktedonobacteraceae bacterium]|jgi:predicted acetylornithine/succinylornithine family transaminase/N-acetyl-ornithine/N-acetyl-lysine deacetylase|nr:[LysW]-lysine hydrolase [Ktedonobacteraceae bacterium]